MKSKKILILLSCIALSKLSFGQIKTGKELITTLKKYTSELTTKSDTIKLNCSSISFHDSINYKINIYKKNKQFYVDFLSEKNLSVRRQKVYSKQEFLNFLLIEENKLKERYTASGSVQKLIVEFKNVKTEYISLKSTFLYYTLWTNI